MGKYAFGFWYGRLRYFKTAKSRKFLRFLKKSRWWRYEWKVSQFLDYLAGFDTRWHGYGKKAKDEIIGRKVV